MSVDRSDRPVRGDDHARATRLECVQDLEPVLDVAVPDPRMALDHDEVAREDGVLEPEERIALGVAAAQGLDDRAVSLEAAPRRRSVGRRRRPASPAVALFHQLTRALRRDDRDVRRSEGLPLTWSACQWLLIAYGDRGDHLGRACAARSDASMLRERVEDDAVVADADEARVPDRARARQRDRGPGVVRDLLEPKLLHRPMLRGASVERAGSEATKRASSAGPSSAAWTAREPTTIPSTSSPAARACSGVEIPKPA